MCCVTRGREGGREGGVGRKQWEGGRKEGRKRRDDRYPYSNGTTIFK